MVCTNLCKVRGSLSLPPTTSVGFFGTVGTSTGGCGRLPRALSRTGTLTLSDRFIGGRLPGRVVRVCYGWRVGLLREKMGAVGFRRRVCDILMMSTTRGFGASMGRLLPSFGFSPIYRRADVDKTGETLTRQIFSFVVVGSPLPSDSKVHLTVSASDGGGSMMLVVMEGRLCVSAFSGISPCNICALPGPASGRVIARTTS